MNSCVLSFVRRRLRGEALACITLCTIGQAIAGAGDVPPTGHPPAETFVLSRAPIRDPWINNEVACTVLVPRGWKFQGEIVWNPDNAFYPTTGRMVVARPGSADAVYTYPRVTFVDGMRESAMRIGGPYLASRYPEGSHYLGNEVRRQVADPSAYVQQFILPRFRPELRNPRIVQVQELAEYARAKADLYGQVPGLRTRSQRVRLSYLLDGQDVEEDFVCTVASAPILQTIGWSGECESYRAARNTLDSQMPLFRTIARSIEVNLDWFADVQSVGQLIERRQINATINAASLSRHLAENQREISDSIRKAYEYHAQVIDRCNDHFDQYIRGVQKYVDPQTGRTIEAPNGYDHVFASASGDVIVTNSHLFNPNQVINGDWHEIHPAR